MSYQKAEHIEKTREHIARVLDAKIYSIGIEYAELGRRLGIPDYRIGRGIDGKRSFDAEELIALCAYCGIQMKELIPQELAQTIIKSRKRRDIEPSDREEK